MIKIFIFNKKSHTIKTLQIMSVDIHFKLKETHISIQKITLYLIMDYRSE
uniref:Uncharacterized protein n=2 Tax=Serratia marcescens TaxID=615 RepID=A0A4P3AG05_SERMA|nr:TPA_exp: hypothetical protein [Serratia marcescens BIDMC 80]DAC77087.1 TPA_exp: hypothetical protein [Serratia marcescens]DAC77131.1 TPA_exp: hypothetical protein [Serratia marcescens]DAC77175.1 TPA_exp: hypothetical protein [Serratia marcescens]